MIFLILASGSPFFAFVSIRWSTSWSWSCQNCCSTCMCCCWSCWAWINWCCCNAAAWSRWLSVTVIPSRTSSCSMQATKAKTVSPEERKSKLRILKKKNVASLYSRVLHTAKSKGEEGLCILWQCTQPKNMNSYFCSSQTTYSVSCWSWTRLVDCTFAGLFGAGIKVLDAASCFQPARVVAKPKVRSLTLEKNGSSYHLSCPFRTDQRAKQHPPPRWKRKRFLQEWMFWYGMILL